MFSRYLVLKLKPNLSNLKNHPRRRLRTRWIQKQKDRKFKDTHDRKTQEKVMKDIKL